MKRKTVATILGATCALSMACFAGCKHEHAYSEKITAPTCEAQGYTTYTCECGDSYKDNYLNALGHQFTNYVSDNNASCDKDGTKTATCDNGCGRTDTKMDTNSKGHLFTDYTSDKNATCEQNGTKTATCDRDCGESDTRVEAGSKLGHKYTNYASDNNATYDEDGTKTAFCDNGCGETDTVRDEGSKKNILDDYTFVEYGEGYEIATYVGPEDYVAIPTEYNGKPVLSIGANIFRNYSSIQSIMIPDCIQNIGNYAFGDCTSLQSVSIGKGLKSIGDGAFADCIKLQSVNILGGIVNAGSSVFGGCPIEEANIHTSAINCIPKNNLKTVVINGGESISASAFYQSQSLQSVVIGSSVKNVGENAFLNCTNLKSLVLEADLNNVGNAAFGNCVKLVEIINKSSMEITAGSVDFGYIGFYAIQILSEEPHANNFIEKDGYIFFNDKETYYLLGYIGSETKLVLPEDINGNTYSINKMAFYNNASLQEIIIPTNINNIGNTAFYGCTNLKFNEFDNAYYVGSADNQYFALVGAKNANITSCVVNENCKFILNAFNNLDSLQSVEIPNSVEKISRYAFYDCDNLQTLTIGSGVKEIGSFAFSSCDALQEIAFSGTRAQWIEIEKEKDWSDRASLITVNCTTGTLKADTIYKNYFNKHEALVEKTIKIDNGVISDKKGDAKYGVSPEIAYKAGSTFTWKLDSKTRGNMTSDACKIACFDENNRYIGRKSLTKYDENGEPTSVVAETVYLSVTMDTVGWFLDGVPEDLKSAGKLTPSYFRFHINGQLIDEIMVIEGTVEDYIELYEGNYVYYNPNI